MDKSTIRVSARALIIQERKLLTVKFRFPEGIAYMLPGGGQNFGETLVDTVLRECQEEIGVTVSVGNLLFVQEYRSWKHKWAEVSNTLHQLNCIFECSVPKDYLPRIGKESDPEQIGVRWLPLDTLEDYAFYPAKMIPTLKNEIVSSTYLGDMN